MAYSKRGPTRTRRMYLYLGRKLTEGVYLLGGVAPGKVNDDFSLDLAELDSFKLRNGIEVHVPQRFNDYTETRRGNTGQVKTFKR